MLRHSRVIALATLILGAGGILGACGTEESVDVDGGAIELAFQGGRIDGSDDPAKAEEPAAAATSFGEDGAPVEAVSAGGETAPSAPPAAEDGERISIKFRDLSLDELDDVQLEDLLDALLYPDEYEDADRVFPAQVQALDAKEVALEGYMIPVVWEETEVVEFMLVRDLLACCFGGAPQPDEWVSVKMPAGQGSEYFSFVPIVVQGVFHISALEDEAGYAAGCYRMDGEKVFKVL